MVVVVAETVVTVPAIEGMRLKRQHTVFKGPVNTERFVLRCRSSRDSIRELDMAGASVRAF